LILAVLQEQDAPVKFRCGFDQARFHFVSGGDDGDMPDIEVVIELSAVNVLAAQ
jgi:hypothetical protein